MREITSARLDFRTMGTGARVRDAADAAGRLGENAGFLASRFAYIASRAADDVLARFDLTTRPYSVLELAAAAEAPSQREIGRVLLLDPSHVLRLVDRLADRGLVERVRGGDDRRITRIRATAEGRRVVDEAAAELGAAYEGLLADMPRPDRDELLRLLRTAAFASVLE